MTMEKLLEGLTAVQMQKAAELSELLYQNASNIAKTNE
jgi:hypothetical protein